MAQVRPQDGDGGRGAVGAEDVEPCCGATCTRARALCGKKTRTPRSGLVCLGPASTARALLQPLPATAAPALAHNPSTAGAAASSTDATLPPSRGACFVFVASSDLVLYLMGSGQYDELALATVLFALLNAFRDVTGRPANEAVLLDHYASLALVLDEAIVEVRGCR